MVQSVQVHVLWDCEAYLYLVQRWADSATRPHAAYELPVIPFAHIDPARPMKAHMHCHGLGASGSLFVII